MSQVRATRDVSADDPHNFLGRDVAKGEVFYTFLSCTYGCVDDIAGIALSEHGPFEYPCFEFPQDAIEEYRP